MSFFATGGIDLGGMGVFATGFDDDCLLKVTDEGLKRLLDALGTASGGYFKVGLFRNNWTPRRYATISSVVPANFSGYTGLQLLKGWTKAVTAGLRAESKNGLFEWTYNGGLIKNTVYGYYVVHPNGSLMWAERFCPDPVVMEVKGRKIKLTLTFHLRNDDLEK